MESHKERADSLAVAIVGAGAVGRSLAAAIQGSPHTVNVVVSRTQDSARLIADEWDVATASTNLADCFSCDLIAICVPDSTIAMVVDILSSFGASLAGRQIVHTSGLVSSAALAPLQSFGAQTASFHPLQTFSRSRLTAFHNLPVAVESEEDETEFAEQLASDLGARPFIISGDQKASYHLVATILSNYSVVLGSLAEELLDHPGMPSLAKFERLVGSTWANIFSKGPGASLTGPVSRGDIGTVHSHLEVLSTERKLLFESYAVLARSAAEMARNNGSISHEQQEELVRLLSRKS